MLEVNFFANPEVTGPHVSGYVATAHYSPEPETVEGILVVVRYLEHESGRGYWSASTHNLDIVDSDNTVFRYAERFDRLEADYSTKFSPVIEAEKIIEEALSETLVRLGHEKRGKRFRIFQDVHLASIPAYWNSNGH